MIGGSSRSIQSRYTSTSAFRRRRSYKYLAREDVSGTCLPIRSRVTPRPCSFTNTRWTGQIALILGDSLQVMTSLARREDLAGKVQMIYVNPRTDQVLHRTFQPAIRQRHVRSVNVT